MADSNQSVNDGRVHKTLYIAVKEIEPGQPVVAGEIRMIRPKVGPTRTLELYIGGRRFATKDAPSEAKALEEAEALKEEAHRRFDANDLLKGLRFKPYRVEDKLDGTD